ncbi:MAG: sigma-70 family RNA polymerase sigma factor [Acidobacteriaceae bacterium]|nr:sigma-70 family RNA polymerase sigma factor [Acidobacteriaceae bacterium]
MSSQDDDLDVDRVLAGDLSGFEGIVRRWQKPLVNLAYRFCRDRERAEEMAQEAFLRAYRALPQWRREAAFSTWLFALATNLYRNELRRIPVPCSPVDAAVAFSAQAEMDVRFEQARRDATVRRAVDSLPEKYRSSLLLFYFHDMDVSSAACSLGIPEGTLKARLARGRVMLRSKLSRLVQPATLKTAPQEPRTTDSPDCLQSGAGSCTTSGSRPAACAAPKEVS